MANYVWTLNCTMCGKTWVADPKRGAKPLTCSKACFSERRKWRLNGWRKPPNWKSWADYKREAQRLINVTVKHLREQAKVSRLNALAVAREQYELQFKGAA
jgi:hypothetical protein